MPNNIILKWGQHTIVSDSHYYFINRWFENATKLVLCRYYVDSIKLKYVLKYTKFNLTVCFQKQLLNIIIDTQKSTDTTYTNNKYTQKTDYYKTPDIIIYAKQTTCCNTIIFSASCWNWRGIPSSLSVRDFQTLGLTKREIELMSIRVLAGGIEMYRNYCRNA